MRIKPGNHMVVCIVDVWLTEAGRAATADPDWTHQQAADAHVCNPSSTMVLSQLCKQARQLL